MQKPIQQTRTRRTGLVLGAAALTVGALVVPGQAASALDLDGPGGTSGSVEPGGGFDLGQPGGGFDLGQPGGDFDLGEPGGDAGADQGVPAVGDPADVSAPALETIVEHGRTFRFIVSAPTGSSVTAVAPTGETATGRTVDGRAALELTLSDKFSWDVRLTASRPGAATTSSVVTLGDAAPHVGAPGQVVVVAEGKAALGIARVTVAGAGGFATIRTTDGRQLATGLFSADGTLTTNVRGAAGLGSLLVDVAGTTHEVPVR